MKLEVKPSFDTINTLFSPFMSLFLFIIFGFLVLLLFIWLIFVIKYTKVQNEIKKEQENKNRIENQRREIIPLFVERMRPLIVKDEEVLSPIKKTHTELFLHPDAEKWETFDHQIQFLLQIQEKHEDLKKDSIFQKVLQEVKSYSLQIEEIKKKIQKLEIQFGKIRKRSIYFLFPGALLYK